MRTPLAQCLTLAGVTFAAYAPALSGEFLWDDDKYVVENPTLRNLAGLRRVWVDPAATPQYYPLVYTTFWIEYHLWGLRPFGYHAVNLALHALTAILFWKLLRRLSVPGAWLAGLVFAVHPVHVESVAWITERKNVLSAVLYLAAALAFLRLYGVDEQRRPAPMRSAAWWYAASVGLFLAALLSKTVTCTWPAAMGLILWWKRGQRIDLLRLTPMLAVGAAMGLVTAYVERAYVGAEGAAWSLSPWEHVLLAGRILCFYVGQLLYPATLAFIYPRWEVDAAEWTQWLYPAGCLAAFALLWMLRRWTGNGPLVAGLLFVVTLAPALGFFNVYFMQFSYVADHFLYHASLGPIALLAAVATRLAYGRAPQAQGATEWRRDRLVGIVLAGVILVLAVNTWAQTTSYLDPKTLWEDTLSKNPRAWIAHHNLGLILEQEGQSHQAERHYREALALRPGTPRVLCNLGALLAERGELMTAIETLTEAAHMAPNYFDARYNLATALARDGQWAQAAVEYRTATRLKPHSADGHFALGVALGRTGDHAGARSALRETLRLDPAHEAARRALTELRE
jgi:tetratricopeptide (TPR) repeat protein